MGGEKAAFDLAGKHPKGSPPRGRGKAETPLPRCNLYGITPAWAGKSFNQDSSGATFRDHPRVGGEKPSLRTLFSTNLGSPPRGRGKVNKLANGAPAVGITPAWAGKRIVPKDCEMGVEDHPRVGGEKICSRLSSSACIGSPPRGRGKGTHADRTE